MNQIHGTNRRKARDAGYRARYAEHERSANPWKSILGSVDYRAGLRDAWYEGWDRADVELGVTHGRSAL